MAPMLVDPSDSPGDSHDHGPFVTVATFHDVDSAHLARVQLGAEGIPCLIIDEHMHSMAWHYNLATGGVKVQVPLEFAPAATLALKPVRPSIDRSGSSKCSFCGSTEFVPGGWNGKRAFGLAVLSLISLGVNPLFGVLMLVCGAIGITKNRRLRCAECGTENEGPGHRGFEVIAKDQSNSL